ncbi:MAG: hypothetical protein E6H08_17270 [Bacteroidetes bacterium]|nr:MAG: hypothetical protein E6H08_17270 [Bacteroidota bacterium]
MKNKFLLASVITTIVLFVLNAIMYVSFLKDFFQNHPAVSPEFMKQLYRSDDQLIIWAIILSSVAIGCLVTTVIYWSGARTFINGLKSGFIFAILFLFSVDFGLLGSTNNFTIAGAFADIICSTTTVTLSCAVAAWILGKKKPN